MFCRPSLCLCQTEIYHDLTVGGAAKLLVDLHLLHLHPSDNVHLSNRGVLVQGATCGPSHPVK